ncbi:MULTISPECIES: DUF2690 domain-containing protein [Streptomyces]|uniref:DUF2690 domain-containing protein n=1 Tax=Streptomyces TaxID=1883 RepID=UPI000464DF73|nr:DUF2690 domain-containing protein [Streptomyces exfoliatus]
MKTLTRKLATVGSALAMAASSLLLASSPASAATSCYASSCQGLDPATTICQNDARTVGTTTPWDAELRYSPTCRAAWARFPTFTPARLTIWVQRSDGNGFYAVKTSGSNAVWTQMVNDKDLLARACAEYEGMGSYNCTSWY